MQLNQSWKHLRHLSFCFRGEHRNPIGLDSFALPLLKAQKARFVYCIYKTDQMKHLLTAIACCLAVAGSAQFIPQPMGYNPDSNSDGFVGAEDLMGLLSLFGTPYDDGDSVDVVTLDYTGFESDTLQIPEHADIVYLLSGEYTGDGNQVSRAAWLPLGSTWKTVIVFGYTTFSYHERCDYFIYTDEPLVDEGVELPYPRHIGYVLGGYNPNWQSDLGGYTIFVRDHFGQWRRESNW